MIMKLRTIRLRPELKIINQKKVISIHERMRHGKRIMNGYPSEKAPDYTVPSIMENLAEIIMLDERIAGRTAPVDSVDHPAISDTTRSMLGSEQLDWFKTRLVSSEAQWKTNWKPSNIQLFKQGLLSSFKTQYGFLGWLSSRTLTTN